MKNDIPKDAAPALAVDAGSDFKGYDEPIGSVVKLHPCTDVRTRLARTFFNRQMFVYFEQVTHGQTGWGVSYNAWLDIHGWKLIGRLTYERVPSLEEQINPNIADDARRGGSA